MKKLTTILPVMLVLLFVAEPAFAQDADTLKDLYRWMMLTREFDTRAVTLQRTGQLGTFPSSLGQEAVGVGLGHAMELLITGRSVDVHEAHRMGLVNEVVPEGRACERALELARSIAELPQGALRADKETVVRGIGRTLEERLRIETEMMMSMWLRKDRHSAGAQAFLDKNLKPEWPNHGL